MNGCFTSGYSHSSGPVNGNQRSATTQCRIPNTRVTIHGQPPAFATNELFLRFDAAPENALGVTLRSPKGENRLENFRLDAAKIRDQWFTLEIIASDSEIIYRINGEIVGRGRDVRFEPGHLSLDVNGVGALLSVRKIEIKELPPTPP